MRHQATPFLTLAAAALLGVIACGETVVESEQPQQVTTVRQQVLVVPEFQITGVEQLPEQLSLTKLGLTVSEIRLEPVNDSVSFVYATRKPLTVGFNVAEGELLKTGQAIEIPESGRYLVSLRVEPITDEEGNSVASLEMEGYITNEQDGEGSDGGETADGSKPLPLPFDGSEYQGEQVEGELSDRADAAPELWTPFDYKSRAAIYVTLSDVQLDEGAQRLTFSFDVQDWANQLIEPIAKAVRNTNSPSGIVDITDVLDSTGRGADALMEYTDVSSSWRRP